MKLIKSFIMAVFITAGIAMAGDYEQTEAYQQLRNLALSLTSDQLQTDSPVLAVIMETGYPQAVATLVAVADGSSSLYFSNGGGIIGGGEYRQINDSSVALVKIAAKNQKKFFLTKTYPLPQTGYTRFYIVTDSGVFTDEVLEDDLGNEKHALSPVFFQGHELISYIMALDEHRRSE